MSHLLRVTFLIVLLVLTLGCEQRTPQEEIAIAETNYSNKDYQSSIIQMKKLLSDDSKSVPARLLLAKSYFQIGSFVNSEKEFNKVIDLGVNTSSILPYYILIL